LHGFLRVISLTYVSVS